MSLDAQTFCSEAFKNTALQACHCDYSRIGSTVASKQNLLGLKHKKRTSREYLEKFIFITLET